MVKIAYVDSSVMVKHYVEDEADSPLASKYITSYKLYASCIMQIEVFSALARKLQLQEISAKDVEKIKEAFLSDCLRIGMIEVSDEVIKEAQDLVFKTSLKTLDAIHLASSILLGRITEAAFPFITSDKKLALMAEKEGFKIIGIGI
jgi:predicted nucleic acid-binding protein